MLNRRVLQETTVVFVPSNGGLLEVRGSEFTTQDAAVIP